MDIENDSAIIYDTDKVIFLTVMITEVDDLQKVRNNITQIADRVY